MNGSGEGRGHGGVIRETGRELEQCGEQVQRQASCSSCSTGVRAAERGEPIHTQQVPEEETTVAKWAQH